MNFYSPIFGPGIAPERPGLYLTSVWRDWHFAILHRWDGKSWFDSSGKGGPNHMIGSPFHGQNRYWRGLAFDPSAIRSGK